MVNLRRGVKKNIMIKLAAKIFCLFTIGALLSLPRSAFGEPAVYRIDKSLSRIEGAVRYTVVGKYEAIIHDFEGEVIFDREDINQCHVTLGLTMDSLESNFPTLDKIVRSEQLLETEKYPKVFFESKFWLKDDNGYRVTGILDLHGVKKEFTFPFSISGPLKDSVGRPFIRAEGTWIINRKDFDIVWNSLFDKGGLLVGNHINVEWEIVAFQKL